MCVPTAEFLAAKHRAAEDLLRELKRERKSACPGRVERYDNARFLRVGKASR
jgi:hypothetical protein